MGKVRNSRFTGRGSGAHTPQRPAFQPDTPKDNVRGSDKSRRKSGLGTKKK